MNAGHLAFPFRAAPLLLVAVFTLGLLIARGAGLLGLWLGILLVSWFFKYCFVLLDAIMAGEEEPPVLSIEMVNPVSEQRPLVAGALIAAGVWLVWSAHSSAGNALGIALAVVLLAALPASLAALAITGNPLKAMWPGVWLELVRGLGRDYLWLSLAMLAFGVGLYAMWRGGLPLWLTLGATQLLFLLIVAFIGGAIHEHRAELGVPTLTRAERFAARSEREFIQTRRQMLDRAYGLLRVGRAVDAWSEIDAWLVAHEARGENIQEYRNVFAAALPWKDARIGDRLADELIGLLLARRDTGVALDVCEQWVGANPQFRPTHARRLAELASVAGKRSLGRRLRIESENGDLTRGG